MFGFIGFRTAEISARAQKYFNNTFLDGQRIVVDFARPIGNEPEAEVNHSGAAVTNRIFVVNLPYDATCDDLSAFFSSFGEVVNAAIPNGRGFGFVTFADVDSAQRALSASLIFQGRHIRLSSAEPPREELRPGGRVPSAAAGPGRDERDFRERSREEAPRIALFANKNAVLDATAARLGVTRAELMSPHSEDLAVRATLAEAEIMAGVNEALREAGLDPDALSARDGRVSNTLMVAKNIPFSVGRAEVESLFTGFGEVLRVVALPGAGCAVVEFARPGDAKAAFHALSFRPLGGQPLLLQWAPAAAARPASCRAVATPEVSSGTLIVKNLPFEATKRELGEVIAPFARVKAIRMPSKADRSGHRGFAFVDFHTKKEAQAALENLGSVHFYDRHLIFQPCEHGRNVAEVLKIGES
jgi:multiple RNA-binding domain-containing protein 1